MTPYERQWVAEARRLVREALAAKGATPWIISRLRAALKALGMLR